MDIFGRIFLGVAAGLGLFALVVLFILGGALLIVGVAVVVHVLLTIAEHSKDGERASLRSETEQALWDAFRRR